MPATHASTPFALNSEQTMAQIAIHIPGSTAIFRRLKLDFCCGGQISLHEAASAKGLDVEALLAELGSLQRARVLPDMTDPKALIAHILERYHAVHRAQLPELIRMATRVEAVHRDKVTVPRGLAALLTQIEDELEDHLQKEEQILFPILQAGGNSFVHNPITMMRFEHSDHGAQLAKLMALTDDATPSSEACTTWRALYTGLAQFHDDLLNHIHVENNILFPLFEAGGQHVFGARA